eukprot:CAMPEP_0116858324 /NCGR_PEP_ID=MMETSP0418-20121206/21107_1 /TAXON_ID=1158023 /ORGANISM="Astrosyne radiata, Strain 13vi08-1A" /LENGTH=351 /DNA_ID=CAMNT_0004492229 /DNA_START=23 /DNA_END=1075 /DNA_ORIENTATION=+
MTDVNSRIEAAKAEIASLKEQIDKAMAGKKDQTMSAVVRSKGLALPNIRGPPATKLRRTLKGHFGKVTAMHWAGDSQALISASQDGKLLLWNAVSTNKLKAISLKSTYVMAVGMEQSKGNLVACGGLDNLCTVYKLSQPDNDQEMASHDGFLSCCRFLDEQRILTGSGDSTVLMWDIPNGVPVETFAEHKNDVMCLAISPTDPNCFVSVSVDRTAKVWDIRDSKAGATQTFSGHEGDINGVDFMRDGITIGTGSEDGTARVFDMRAHNEICKYGKVTEGEGLTSVSFSRSGRVLFGGHADSNVLAWDVLSDKATPTFTLNQAHEQHVSCLGVNPKGDALCTGSWDSTLKIW